MKKYILIIISAVMMLMVSCDVLDQVPESDITQANFWKTPRDAESGLVAVYSLFMNSTYRIFELGEVRSDNVVMPPKWGYEMINPGLMDFNRNIISPTDGYSNWVTFYNVVARANEVIYYTEKIDFSNANDKNRILGEALFLRAIAYFNLGKNWGAVPLITEPFFTQGENMYVERTSVNLIFEQIVKDLTLAEQYLPTTRSDLRIRASKAAAQALFCDVLLTRGYTSFAQSTDFATAITKANAVIANTNYTLEQGAKYADIFRKNNNPETIFAVWFDYKNSATQNFCNFFLPRAYNKSRPYGGESLMLPSHSLVNSFEQGDLRASTTYTVLAKEEEKYYDANVVGMTYGNKYLGTVTDVGVQRYSDNHVIIYRLPDVMLMKAEALVKTNQAPDGLAIVNQIRSRAGLTPKTAAAADDVLNLILSERQKELAFEGKRWYDLVRTNKIDEFRTESEFVKGRILLALPQTEVDRNPKLLPQNPTY
jgi:starch-binding outer membrane protein, SusD/RagB family